MIRIKNNQIKNAVIVLCLLISVIVSFNIVNNIKILN